mgnify:CR=1 FL=1|tara:strand:+ start:24 stop:614 length:591 start_codon:yes stop_codon:yes gene_type:complete
MNVEVEIQEINTKLDKITRILLMSDSDKRKFIEGQKNRPISMEEFEKKYLQVLAQKKWMERMEQWESEYSAALERAGDQPQWEEFAGDSPAQSGPDYDTWKQQFEEKMQQWWESPEGIELQRWKMDNPRPNDLETEEEIKLQLTPEEEGELASLAVLHQAELNEWEQQYQGGGYRKKTRKRRTRKYSRKKRTRRKA